MPHRWVAVALVTVVLLAVAALVAARLIGVDRQGADVTTIHIDSAAVDHTLPTTVVVPSGAHEVEHPPLLVFLHGRGGDERSELDDAFFSALAELGTRAPVVALPSGGDHSYWHDRADGNWGRYVVREVIPTVVRQFGADPRRVAIGGISMGGFGAYDIARLHPGRFCAVAGHSPAIWRSGGETAPGAFDDTEDFARHDLVAAAQTRSRAYSATRLWIDAGDSDPFRPGVDALTTALKAGGARIASRTWSGGHEGDYWNAHWKNYAAFYARALKRC